MEDPCNLTNSNREKLTDSNDRQTVATILMPEHGSSLSAPVTDAVLVRHGRVSGKLRDYVAENRLGRNDLGEASGYIRTCKLYCDAGNKID